MIQRTIMVVLTVGLATGAAQAQPATLFFALDQDNPILGENPTLQLAPGESGQLHLFGQLTADQSLRELGLMLSTPTPELADCGQTFIANPVLPVGGGTTRWGDFLAWPCGAEGTTLEDPAFPGLDSSVLWSAWQPVEPARHCGKDVLLTFDRAD